MTTMAMRSVVLATVLCACGGDHTGPPITYTDPATGALRLIRDPASSAATAVVLDLVVGDQPLTGYSVGFNLPLDDTAVTFMGFTPGTALSAGTSPVAALGQLSATGPLAHQLVVAQSQKASGAGAIAADTTLAPGSVLFSFELDLAHGAPGGVIFDGTSRNFVLASGGMRDRAGTTVVEAKDVAIGRLEVTP